MYLRIRIYEIIFNCFFKLSQMQLDYWSESYKKLHIEKKILYCVYTIEWLPLWAPHGNPFQSTNNKELSLLCSWILFL